MQILDDVYKAASSKKGLPDSEVDTDHPTGMGIGTTPDDPKVGRNWHGTQKSTKVSDSVSAVLAKEHAEQIKKNRKSLKKGKDVPFGTDEWFEKQTLPKIAERFRQKIKDIAHEVQADKTKKPIPAHVISEGKRKPVKEGPFAHGYRTGLAGKKKGRGGGKGKTPLLIIARKIGRIVATGGKRGGKVSAGSTQYKRGRIQRPRTSRGTSRR